MPYTFINHKEGEIFYPNSFYSTKGRESYTLVDYISSLCVFEVPCSRNNNLLCPQIKTHGIVHCCKENP